MANVQIVHGSIETIDVTIQDASGVVTSLDIYGPKYTVIPIDSVLLTEKNEYYYKYWLKPAVNSGMMIQCLIDTTGWYQWGRLEATNAPTLPLTITAGSNDTFKWNTVSFTFPAGTYNTIAALATAMGLSVDGSAHALHSIYYGMKVVATDNGKLALVQDYTLDTTTDHFATDQVQNGATHNALPSIGFTNAQAMPSSGIDTTQPWAVGTYDLYVTWTVSGESPLLGPISFQVV